MTTSRRRFLQTLGAAGAVAATHSLVAPLAGRIAGAEALAQGAAAPAETGPFTLPPLPYAADALEPHLDALTMTIHHDKHHAAYVANLNKAVAGRPELAQKPVSELLRDFGALPPEIVPAVRNHGGGHYNHSLLWPSLKKDGARAPKGELAAAIDKQWGSFAAFQEKFNASAMAVFGSGWAWLVQSPRAGLAIANTPNQDTLLSGGVIPLLGIDVWEHAYYLKFQNRRADYVAEFAKVVDWDAISSRYRDALEG
jgi:Fe-Mn family superoxide dismutase